MPLGSPASSRTLQSQHSLLLIAQLLCAGCQLQPRLNALTSLRQTTAWTSQATCCSFAILVIIHLMYLNLSAPTPRPSLVRSYRHELLLCGKCLGDGESRPGGFERHLSLQNSLFHCVFSLSVRCTNRTVFFRGNPGNNNSALPWPAGRADINHTHRIWLCWNPIRSNRSLSLHI